MPDHSNLNLLVFDKNAQKRAVLLSCGWAGDRDAPVPDDGGAVGGGPDTERSAALSLWWGDLAGCARALRDGSAALRASAAGGDDPEWDRDRAESLGLVAVCVAGFAVSPAGDGPSGGTATPAWTGACDDLLSRLPSDREVAQAAGRGSQILRHNKAAGAHASLPITASDGTRNSELERQLPFLEAKLNGLPFPRALDLNSSRLPSRGRGREAVSEERQKEEIPVYSIRLH